MSRPNHLNVRSPPTKPTHTRALSRNALVFRARDRATQRPVVVKVYDPRRGAAHQQHETAMLRTAGPHPCVLRVVEGAGAADDHTDGPPPAPLLVLESCCGGTLIEAMANSGGRLSERVAARKIATPLLKGLAHLHARGIVHRCGMCVGQGSMQG